MAKVLYFSVPQYGQVHPSLPLVRELVQRGEQVLYYLVTDRFKELIEANGATLRLYKRPPVQTGLTFIASFVDHLRQMIVQLLEEVRAEQPDYIVYDSYCTHARLLAQILHIPAILISSHMFVIEEMVHQLDRKVLYETHNLFATNSMNEFRETLEPLCAEYQLPMFSLPEIKTYAEPLNISFIPRSLQPAEEAFDERFLFLGSSIEPESRPSGITLPQSTEGPILYIALGTLINNWKEFYLYCFEAFAGLPFQVVISVGPKIDQATFGSIPENISVYPFVPQLEVLSRSAAFICHGGTNSVIEALHYGVPLVIVPLAAEDEFVNAKLLQELKLGVAVEKSDLSASTLRAAALQVMYEKEYRQNALLMSDTIKASGGYRAAADAILDYVSHK